MANDLAGFVPHAETVDTAAWLLRTGLATTEFTEGQIRCLQTLLAVAPWHRLVLLSPHEASVEVFPDGLAVLLNGTMSTTDDSALTRLVVAAHDNAVRVQFGAWYTVHGDDSDRGTQIRQAVADDLGYDADEITVKAMRVLLTARHRDPQNRYEHHPTLEAAAGWFRQNPHSRRR